MPTQHKKNASLPLIPLTRGAVLLPGIVQRIPVSANRPDIPALLASLLEEVSLGPNERINTAVCCVPIRSPYLGPDGQLLIGDGEHPDDLKWPDVNPAELDKSDLFKYGVSARVLGIDGRGLGDFALRVEGVSRCRIKQVTKDRLYFEATDLDHCPDEVPVKDKEFHTLFVNLKTQSRELVNLLRISALLPRNDTRTGLSPLLTQRLDLFIVKRQIEEAGQLADFMANIVESSYEEKLQVLAAVDVKVRLAKVIELVGRQVALIKGNFKITTLEFIPSQILDRLNDRSTRRPSGALPPTSVMTFMQPGGNPPPDGEDREKEPSELDILREKLDHAKLPPDAAKVADRELRHVRNMMPGGQEYANIVNWLTTLSEVPWSKLTNDRLGPETSKRARRQLDDDHYGLDKVKTRLVQYVAVLRRKQIANDKLDEEIKKAEETAAVPDDASSPPSDAPSAGSEAHAVKVGLLQARLMPDKSPILLLVGPPGVGKTSLAKSIATALGRKFHRISLGGVRDEAEIRGHRRTYVAAMPGIIIQGLKKVGVANPVFLLDEIDKLGKVSNMGDPSAAMLEVLDPEQNHTFTDHYLGTPFDLSRVLFIATANILDDIPPPLLDRMETIHLTGYTTIEKRQIAMQHLIPKQILANGLSEGQVILGEEVISKIIESYTRESGVRNLEREIGSLCRAKAVDFTEAEDSGRLPAYRPEISLQDVEEVLGIEKFEAEIAEKTSRPGVVTGLVAYSSGGNGGILFIEVTDMPGDGKVQLTGRLGSVLKESVEVALSWVKSHAYELGLTSEPSVDVMDGRSIHVHCPSGAIPKDGPSSGLAQAINLISLFSGNAVPPTMAMTGEISLRGRITAVGGIADKLIGAHRAGVKTVLLPSQNRKDLKDVPQEVKNGLEVFHVSDIWQAIRIVWPDSQWAADQLAGIESRL